MPDFKRFNSYSTVEYFYLFYILNFLLPFCVDIFKILTPLTKVSVGSNVAEYQ